MKTIADAGGKDHHRPSDLIASRIGGNTNRGMARLHTDILDRASR